MIHLMVAENRAVHPRSPHRDRARDPARSLLCPVFDGSYLARNDIPPFFPRFCFAVVERFSVRHGG